MIVLTVVVFVWFVEYDPVTMIDAQAGMIQRISCNTPHLSMQLSCHMLEGTLCNLLEHCGDDDRKRIASCAFEHKISSVTDALLGQVASAVSPATLVAVAILAAIVLSVLLRRRSNNGSNGSNGNGNSRRRRWPPSPATSPPGTRRRSSPAPAVPRRLSLLTKKNA